MRFFGRNLVTLLLIAVMAMPAVSSPALRHSHTDGDRSHQHDVAKVERHEHSHGAKHSHASRHSRRGETTTAKHSHDHRATRSAKSPVEHFHVFWFGFESSMPMPVPAHSDSQRPMASVDQWVPLISEITLPDAAADGSSVRVTDLAIPMVLEPHLAVRSEVRPLRDSAVAWLCDTARRERSGVLVI